MLRDRRGVSPVIGIMLMIVATLLLAAAVSSFSTTLTLGEKVPQLSIRVYASDSTGVKIEHMGGDTLAASDMRIVTYIPSGTYAGSTYEIPKNKIKNLRTGNYLASYEFFKSGDVLIVESIDDCFGTGWSLYKPEIGEQFRVEIYHTTSGKPVAFATVTLEP